MDSLLVDRSVECLWIFVSADGQSRLRPHTVREQSRHGHVFLLPQRAGRLGAGGRAKVMIMNTVVSSNAIYYAFT